MEWNVDHYLNQLGISGIRFVLTNLMPFLPVNQQFQSTESNWDLNLGIPYVKRVSFGLSL